MGQDTSVHILVYHRTRAHEYAKELEASGVRSFSVATTPGQAMSAVKRAEVLFAWGFPLELLVDAKALRWIQSTGAGVDDLVRQKSQIPNGVTVTRIVNQFGGPMSEYVFSYLLYHTKRIEALRSQQLQRAWHPFEPDELAGKTIGVAGLGSIGAEMVRKARAFDMTVHGLSYTGERAGLVDKHFHPNEWLPFVAELDFLVLALPLTNLTKGVIDRRVLFGMKPQSGLINVGRGQLVNEAALVEVVRAGHLGWAALDVFGQEPLPDGHPFWALPNVHVTPHISGVSSISKTTAFFLQNLARYQAQQELLGTVDLTQGY